uniref:Intracellular protein transport protein USO1-like n=1 Tax=Angiostrongylus cantonensis TaxID=6313 RepID=A0A0K0DN30_ANGCA
MISIDIDAKAENERLQAVQSELKNEKDKLSRDFGTCSSALRSCKLNTETLQSENMMLEKQSRNTDVINGGLQQKIEEITKNNESLKKAVSDQGAIVDQLKGTIRKLEAELNRTKLHSTDKGSTIVVDESGTTKIGFIEANTISVTQRTVEVTQEQRRIVEDKQIDQAPAPMIVESSVQTVKQKTGAAEMIGDEHGPDVPPQKPGDRVKLAVAADERSKDEKPVVKGGNYDAAEEDVDDGLQGGQ